MQVTYCKNYIINLYLPVHFVQGSSYATILFDNGEKIGYFIEGKEFSKRHLILYCIFLKNIDVCLLLEMSAVCQI